MPDLASLLDQVNFPIPFGRWQLFEFPDLWIVPPFIKHDRQDALAARWNLKIPVLQSRSPAELAAEILNACLQKLPDIDTARWTVLDIGSGNGGPVPVIDKVVNNGRKDMGKKPILFQLSDVNPNLNLDTWMVHSAESTSLSFIPDAVDATNPPFSAISTTTAGDKEAAFVAGLESNGRKVFRLFCATFHHFDDETAVKALKSTLETSDAFAIIELQERNILSLALVLLEGFLFMLMAIFWFRKDPIHLIFTYVIPLLPIMQCLDAFVSCLRIRSFEEILDLISRPYGAKPNLQSEMIEDNLFRFRNWEFRHVRTVHTWPIGYMKVITGKYNPLDQSTYSN